MSGTGGAAPDGATGGGTPRREPGAVLSGTAVALGAALFLGASLWCALVYRPYTVATGSMAPAIGAGDRVLAQRVDGAAVRRGDVVVFDRPVWGDLPLVKRVVAVGGDTVARVDGGLLVNGAEVDAASPAGPPAADFPAVVVPTGRLFLLGDARGDSLDSASHLRDGRDGTVPRDAVLARVDAVVWPPGPVTRPAAFAELPGGTSRPGPLRPLLTAAGTGAALVLGGAAYGPLARRAARRSTRGGSGTPRNRTLA
ncbi:signal peptidase I [Streptomyces sp. JNUCC 64]